VSNSRDFAGLWFCSTPCSGLGVACKSGDQALGFAILVPALLRSGYTAAPKPPFGEERRLWRRHPYLPRPRKWFPTDWPMAETTSACSSSTKFEIFCRTAFAHMPVRHGGGVSMLAG